MSVIEQAELTVYIGIKLKMSFMDKFIVAVIFLHFTQPGIQCVHEPHCSGPILQFFFNQRYCLIIIHAHVIGTRHIVRCIVQTGVNGPRHLSPLILWDLCDGILAGESFLRDQALILLGHIGDGQMDGIIFLGIVIPFIVQPLVSLGVSIPGAGSATVLAKAALDEFLVFIRRVGIAEMGIDRQPAFDALPQKVMVDLVLRDEHFALPQEVRLCGKVPLRVGQTVQHNTNPVGVIATDTETHDVRGRGVGVEEGMIFRCQSLQSTLCLCERHHILVQFRVALVLVVNRQCLWEKALRAAFFVQVTGGHQEGVHCFVQHLVRGLRQFGGREISPSLQQIQNTGRRLFPCDHGFAVPGADAVPLGEVDAVLQKPHGVLAAFVFNTAPVIPIELSAQKLFIFLLWPLPHIKYGDALRAVGFVSACAECQVNDLLRHRAGRSQNAGGRVCRSLVNRGVAAHVE